MVRRVHASIPPVCWIGHSYSHDVFLPIQRHSPICKKVIAPKQERELSETKEWLPRLIHGIASFRETKGKQK